MYNSSLRVETTFMLGVETPQQIILTLCVLETLNSCFYIDRKIIYFIEMHALLRCYHSYSDTFKKGNKIANYIRMIINIQKIYLYMFITIPGEQYPHCVPLKLAKRDWISWYPVVLLPIPSTVVTAHPWQAKIGVRHWKKHQHLFVVYSYT